MSRGIEDALGRFRNHFGREPAAAARAPGRVNLIGEHTDYNGGYVLPMAIERDTLVIGAPRQDQLLNAYAENLDATVSCPLLPAQRQPHAPWADYVAGVAREVALLGHDLPGLDLLITGAVPMGAGLSSSASLEMAALKLFETLGGFALDSQTAAQLGQRVENDFLGLRTGIMDQFAVRAARRGHVILLDCRSLEHTHIPAAFQDAVIIVADTGVPRTVAGSKYNERVAECAQAVAQLNESGYPAESLRDVSIDALEARRDRMTPIAYRRARHVITENARTVAACAALKAGSLQEFGQLMNASHASLRRDYEVSCPELDAMTDLAHALPGCLGARMTGAGFGGCTVSLVEAEHAERFAPELMARYAEKTGRTGAAFATRAARGAAGEWVRELPGPSL